MAKASKKVSKKSVTKVAKVVKAPKVPKVKIPKVGLGNPLFRPNSDIPLFNMLRIIRSAAGLQHCFISIW